MNTIFSNMSLLALMSISSMLLAEENNPHINQPNSGFSAQIRFGFSQTEDSTGNNNVNSAALGGKFGYTSPTWKGLTAGITGYTSHIIGNHDDDDLFLNSNGGPNGSGYNILGELWGQAQFSNTRIKVGRQVIDSPFADTDDVGMIPNTFQGAVITHTSLPNTTFIGMHLNKAAGVDGQKEAFTSINIAQSNSAVNVLAVLYDADSWNTQLWHYKQNKGTNISYAELALTPLESFDIGLQYTTQKDDSSGGKANAWGATAAYSIVNFTLSADYNKTSGSNPVINAVGGVGGGPFFTSAEQNTIDGVVGIRANAIGVEYSGIKDITLGVRKIDFDKGVGDEIDLTASYQIKQSLSADLIISDMDVNGKNSRFFINYNF